jgi:hypothetical protein
MSHPEMDMFVGGPYMWRLGGPLILWRTTFGQRLVYLPGLLARVGWTIRNPIGLGSDIDA